MGAVDRGGIWHKGNLPVLPKSLFKDAAVLIHGQSHVSTGGMVGMVKQHFVAYGITNYFFKLLLTVYYMGYKYEET